MIMIGMRQCNNVSKSTSLINRNLTANAMNTVKRVLANFPVLLHNRLVIFGGTFLILVGGGIGVNALIHTSNTSSFSTSPDSTRSASSQPSVSANTPNTPSSSAATTQSSSSSPTPETAPTDTSSGYSPTAPSPTPSSQPTCDEESQITELQAEIQQDLNNITTVRNESSNLAQNPYEPLSAWQEQLDLYESTLQTATQQYQDQSALLVSLDKDCQE